MDHRVGTAERRLQAGRGVRGSEVQRRPGHLVVRVPTLRGTADEPDDVVDAVGSELAEQGGAEVAAGPGDDDAHGSP